MVSLGKHCVRIDKEMVFSELVLKYIAQFRQSIDIQGRLRSKNILYEDEMLKVQLLSIATEHKKEYYKYVIF